MSGFVEWLLLTMDNRRRFPVNFANFIRTPFFTEQLRWLLLLWAKEGFFNLTGWIKYFDNIAQISL